MPGLSRGVGQVEGGIAKSVKRKKISGLEGEKFMSSLIGTIDYDRFKEVRTAQMTNRIFCANAFLFCWSKVGVKPLSFRASLIKVHFGNGK